MIPKAIIAIVRVARRAFVLRVPNATAIYFISRVSVLKGFSKF
jgi:hypothetical protein